MSDCFCRYVLILYAAPAASQLTYEKQQNDMDYNLGSEGSPGHFDLPFKTPKVQFDFIDTNKVTDFHRN